MCNLLHSAFISIKLLVILVVLGFHCQILKRKTCFVSFLVYIHISLLCRKCRNCGRKTVNLPLFDEVSILSLVVLLFCVAFAVVWAIHRQASYSWVGQDILVSLNHVLGPLLLFFFYTNDCSCGTCDCLIFA